MFLSFPHFILKWCVLKHRFSTKVAWVKRLDVPLSCLVNASNLSLSFLICKMGIIATFPICVTMSKISDVGQHSLIESYWKKKKKRAHVSQGMSENIFFFCLITALTPLKVVREEGCGVLNIRAVCWSDRCWCPVWNNVFLLDCPDWSFPAAGHQGCTGGALAISVCIGGWRQAGELRSKESSFSEALSISVVTKDSPKLV